MALGGLLGGGSDAVLKIKTTAGSDKLLALRMEGKESLGRLPEYRVDVVGNVDMMGNPEDIDVHALLGTRANVTVDLFNQPREFNGFITRMQRGERHGRYESFSIVMRPWLWFATRSRNSMVFQNKSVKDIVTEVLKPYSTDMEWRLAMPTAYPKLEYVIQYDESDFDFVSRLLEDYGIYYFFEHTDTKHTLVLIDALAKHKSKENSDAIKWANSLKERHSITDWLVQEEVRAVKATVRDHDYLASATKIEQSKPAKPTQATAKLGPGEIYEFPGGLGVVQNQVKDAAQPAASAATERAKVLMEEAFSLQKTATGRTNAHDIACGATFQIKEEGGGLLGGLMGGGESKREGKYLVVSVDYRMEFADHEAIEDLKSISRRRDGFIANVLTIDADELPFRPVRSTPRPRMAGPQTAVVVGASGNEIETDKHGRVKIQFHWDRKGQKNQDSSCWVRVAQPHAGKSFGFWSVPRVGQEVVVDFIGGDPDRPIITGSVYNDANPIAYELPKLSTVSGWRSRSTKDGTLEMFNELRFDDAKGKEYVWLQAQKDFYRSVKENAFDMVLKNETVKVKLTRMEVIGENWFVNVGKDVMHEYGKDMHVKVAGDIFYTGAATLQAQFTKDIQIKGDATFGLDIKDKFDVKAGGDLKVKSTGALHLKTDNNLLAEATQKLSLKAGADLLAEGINVKIKGGAEVVIEGTAGVKLVCGGSSIALSAGGVDIVGPMVKINSGGGGGSAGSAQAATAAEPKAPTEAKNEEKLTPAKEKDYDEQFKDPIEKAKGGAGGGGGAAGA